MSDQDSNLPDDALRQRALSRWDNKGGAGVDGPQEALIPNDPTRIPNTGEAELVLLHVRVIVLENLIIALLAGASDKQLEMAREMAPLISPRPGSTAHPLTSRAAEHMVDLLERASRFRSSGNRPEQAGCAQATSATSINGAGNAKDRVRRRRHPGRCGDCR